MASSSSNGSGEPPGVADGVGAIGDRSQRPRGKPTLWSGAGCPGRDAHDSVWVRLEPLAVWHARSLFRFSHAPNAGPELWDYLPYGPCSAAEELADWIAGAPVDDPVFFAVCDRSDGAAVESRA